MDWIRKMQAAGGRRGSQTVLPIVTQHCILTYPSQMLLELRIFQVPTSLLKMAHQRVIYKGSFQPVDQTSPSSLLVQEGEADFSWQGVRNTSTTWSTFSFFPYSAVQMLELNTIIILKLTFFALHWSISWIFLWHCEICTYKYSN